MTIYALDLWEHTPRAWPSWPGARSPCSTPSGCDRPGGGACWPGWPSVWPPRMRDRGVRVRLRGHRRGLRLAAGRARALRARWCVGAASGVGLAVLRGQRRCSRSAVPWASTIRAARASGTRPGWAELGLCRAARGGDHVRQPAGVHRSRRAPSSSWLLAARCSSSWPTGRPSAATSARPSWPPSSWSCSTCRPGGPGPRLRARAWWPPRPSPPSAWCWPGRTPSCPRVAALIALLALPDRLVHRLHRRGDPAVGRPLHPDQRAAAGRGRRRPPAPSRPLGPTLFLVGPGRRGHGVRPGLDVACGPTRWPGPAPGSAPGPSRWWCRTCSSGCGSRASYEPDHRWLTVSDRGPSWTRPARIVTDAGFDRFGLITDDDRVGPAAGAVPGYHAGVPSGAALAGRRTSGTPSTPGTARDRGARAGPGRPSVAAGPGRRPLLGARGALAVVLLLGLS